MPILTKWVLIGRWSAERIPIWSLGYVRFWLVRALIRTNPMVLFIGSPLYLLYLRALGARIGPGVTILSRTVPVCTDLISVGAGSVIRKDCRISGYRARDGVIETGPTLLGDGVLVGEATVLDINTRMDDHTQLGHSSSLHAGQVVPSGQHWHGSPARPTSVEYGGVPAARCGTFRRFAFGALQLVATIGIGLPAAVAVSMSAVEWFLGSTVIGQSGWTAVAYLLLVDGVVFFGGLLTLVVASLTLPRALNLALRPGKVYPLYGIHHSIQRAVARMTNIGFVLYLFGDSSAIAHYLRWLGYHMPTSSSRGPTSGSRPNTSRRTCALWAGGPWSPTAFR